ncbi:MAG: molybdopterin-dependent oxidoreductase [Ilumatobacteraceae bacterium]
MTELAEVDPAAPRDADVWAAPPRWAGAVAGVVAGALGLFVGHVVAQFGDGVSPLDLVGSSFVDRTPRWLKEWAIANFGTNDKLVLEIGAYCVMFVVALSLGVTSRRRATVYTIGSFAVALVRSVSAAERAGTPGLSIFAPFVGAAIGSIVFAVACDALVGKWLDARRPHVSRVPVGWDRRRFLRTTVAAGTAASIAGVVSTRREGDRLDRIESQRPTSLPSADGGAVSADEFHPTDPFVTPISDFYRIDTALSFPNVDLDRWRLRISGLVDQPVELSYQDLLARPQVERTITLCCVSNEIGGPLIGNAVWQGVLLSELLSEAGVADEAEQVFSTSLDGWTCGFPVENALDGRDCLVALGMNGEALPLVHGFPARLVVPGLYGYVSATKWLSTIELTTWDRRGYWIPRGWSRLGPVKTQSRIDVPRRGQTVSSGEFVIAGTAWAQHTGIATVEVRVDDEPWREATLADDVSDDTWRQWKILWNATPGEHRLTVRATDKSGYTQTDRVAPVAPDGATGWHYRRIKVV